MPSIAFYALDRALKSELKPIYVLYGQEAFLVEESLAKIRQAAQARGYQGYLKLTMQAPSFSWANFYTQARHPSLLDEYSILELHFTHSKIDQEASKHLIEYAQTPATDKIFILIFHYLDLASQQSQCFQTLNHLASVIRIWPFNLEQSKKWIQHQALKKGLHISPEGIERLFFYTEGDLGNAAQAIEKLSLLYSPEHKISVADIQENLIDLAQFDWFDWVSAFLLGDQEKSLKILLYFEQKNLEPSFILWGLAQTFRTLYRIEKGLQEGQKALELFKAQKIRPKEQIQYQAFLKRSSRSDIHSAFIQLHYLDLVSKGLIQGEFWQELQQWCASQLCQHSEIKINPSFQKTKFT